MTEDLSMRLSTGITGLDEILGGGLIPARAYLLRGGPGTGKTTVGLHFLTSSDPRVEKPLFITMGETEEQIRKNAEAVGFDLEGVTFLDLSPSPAFFNEVQSYDIFAPAEVEREPTTRQITAQVESLKPQRVFLDAMTQFRYLASDAFQFRKQALSFLRFLIEQGATVLFTSEAGREAPDDDLQFMADGVIHLDFTADGRTLGVSKFRGSDFRSGLHAMKLSSNGAEVFPRLLPDSYREQFAAEALPSGVPELDELLHGGLERGRSASSAAPLAWARLPWGCSS
jgi:circadian clock protein KaiC